MSGNATERTRSGRIADSAVRNALRHESNRLELAVVGGDNSPAARAVKLMYETGGYEGITLTPSDEHEAIELLAGMGKFYLFDELVAGAERLSESIHSVATRGLQEVVQNAEDQRASTVRFGYRKGRKGRGELLVAHDGKPVELRDVLRMSLPLISGSREDAEKIGQFGVGLKTLKQLGPRASGALSTSSELLDRGRTHQAGECSPADLGLLECGRQRDALRPCSEGQGLRPRLLRGLDREMGCLLAPLLGSRLDGGAD